jgi:hypothetical protein
MRCGAHLAFALGMAAVAGGASAQSVAPEPTQKLANRAALNDAAFAPSKAVAADLSDAAISWQSSEVRLSRRAAGPVDSVRINIGSGQRLPGLAPEKDRFDVTLIRSWPGAVRFDDGALAFDIAPHAGFGVSTFGTQAEGGATLTVSKSRGERALEQLRDLGVKDGTSFGDRGRWYLFAAASGRAVGMNVLRGENGWDRAGWSTDASGALVGDAQVGVGWRKGDVQSSFGVIHREVKGRHMIFGQQTRDDTVAAFTFSLRPQQ